MKYQLAAALALSGLSSLHAGFERELIVGWDFSQVSDYYQETGLDTYWDLSYTEVGSLNSFSLFTHNDLVNDGKVGTIFWDGQHGSSSNFVYGSYDKDIGGAVGTTNANATIINRDLPPYFSTNDGGRTYTEALGINARDGSIVIYVPHSGKWGEIQLSYAAGAYGTGEDAAKFITWDYSTDGVNYTSFPTAQDTTAIPSNFAFSARTVDLSMVTALDFAQDLYFRANFGGTRVGASTSFNSVAAIDNIQITGIIPEPTTYAALAGALALGWVAYRRRR